MNKANERSTARGCGPLASSAAGPTRRVIPSTTITSLALIGIALLLGACGATSQSITPRPCHDGQLAVRITAVIGITGTTVIPVVVRNKSPTGCTLRGYPAIRVFGPDGRRVTPLVVTHGEGSPKEPSRVRTVLLIRGNRTGIFDLSFGDHPSPVPAADCRRINSVEVQLPGQSVWLAARQPLQSFDCTGQPPEIAVSPVGAS